MGADPLRAAPFLIIVAGSDVMMNYKMVVFDYDGTLKYLHETKITQSVENVLRGLKALGLKVVVATGRPHNYCQYLLEEGLIDCLISANGSLAKTKDEVIYQNIVEPAQVQSLYDYAHKKQLPLVFYSHEMETNGFSNRHLIRGLQESMNLTAEELLPFVEKRSQDYYLLCAYLPTPEEELLKRQCPEMTIYRWHQDIVSCLSCMVTKLDGITAVMARFGVTSDELIAVGDGGNDLEMIKLAAEGVAVKGGSKLLQQQADYVIHSVGEDFMPLLKQINEKKPY